MKRLLHPEVALGRPVRSRRADRLTDSVEDLRKRWEREKAESEMLVEELRKVRAGVDQVWQRSPSEFAPIAQVTFDGKAKIEQTNAEAAALLGIPPDTLRNMPFSALVCVQDLSIFLEHLRNCRNSHSRKIVSELRVQTAARVSLPVQLVSVPLHQETGSVFQTALLDVTDRQRAEIIARGERANAEKIVQTIPLPLLLLDHTLRIRKVNRAFCEIFHATASIAEGRMLAQLEDVRWKSSGLFGRLREALVNGSAIVHFQVHCEVSTRRDPLVLLLQARRLERPDHSASDLLLVFEDITRSEQARQEREHLMRQLQTARDDLEKRIQERTAELVAANARLQALSRRLVDAQETERRRIACELHDEVGQSLTALKLFLNSQVRSLPLEFSGAFHETAAALDELLEQVRRMALDLRPHVLDDLGLLAALQWHFKTYQARTKIRIRFTHSAMTEELITPRLKNAVFRITQEALTNVARHARVKEAFVRLRQSSLALQFEVTDTGRGFDPQLVASTVSSGLSNIQERVSVAAGQCSIISAPGRGTKLTVKLPLAPHTTEESGT